MNFSNKFQLQLISSENSNIHNLIFYFKYILIQNKIFDLKIQKTQLPLKIKKFTLLKSPHIFKTARTQLEIRKLKKTITIRNFKNIKEIQIFKKILIKIIKNIPSTIRLKVKTFKLIFI